MNNLNNKTKIVSYISVFIVLNILYLSIFLNEEIWKFFIFDIASALFLIKSFNAKKEDSTTEINRTQALGIKTFYEILCWLAFLLLVNLGVYLIVHNVQALFVADFFVAIIFFCWLSYKKSKESEALMKNIAGELKFSYVKTGDTRNLSGPLFEIGHDRKVKNVFSGTFEGFPVCIFDYTFRKGFGKNTLPFGFTLFEISVGSKMPTMVISSKQQGTYSSVEKIEDEIIKNGEVSILEGDFPKFFSVKVDGGKQMEIRQILSPEIMVYLIDEANLFSFIFSGEKLYICLKNFYTDAEPSSDFSKTEFLNNIEKARYLILKWKTSMLKMDY